MRWRASARWSIRWPCASSCPAGATFADLLNEVREQFLDAMEHQDMPFEVLVGQLHLERDASLSPLFGVMLNMLNTPPAVVDMPGLAVERTELDRCGAQFDLTLTVDRLHTRSVWFEYATDLYAGETIELIMSRFEALLHAAADDPRPEPGPDAPPHAPGSRADSPLEAWATCPRGWAFRCMQWWPRWPRHARNRLPCACGAACAHLRRTAATGRSAGFAD